MTIARGGPLVCPGIRGSVQASRVKKSDLEELVNRKVKNKLRQFEDITDSLSTSLKRISTKYISPKYLFCAWKDFQGQISHPPKIIMERIGVA